MFARGTIYDDGYYNDYNQRFRSSYVQISDGYSVADGINESFLDTYSVLDSLPSITHVTDQENGSYIFLNNEQQICTESLD